MTRATEKFRGLRAARGPLPQPTTMVFATFLAGGLLGAVACVEQTEEKPTEQDMEVIKKNLLSEAPKPQFAVNADLDGKVTYLGLDVTANPVEAGKEFKLTHYWKVNAAPGPGWRLFTHLNGPTGAPFLNVDHGPVGGRYPVSQWKQGDIIRDEHAMRLPVTWPHDKLVVHVGLWRGQERMAILAGPKDPAGRLVAATIPVLTKAPAPTAAAKRYVARKISKPLKIDGKMDEAAWKDAPSTGLFVNTMTGAPAAHKTEAKILWDAQNVYIGFENADSDVWSSLTKRDDKLWTQEVVEVMIDADRNGKSYVELQVAPNGTLFDTYLPEYRKHESTVDPKRKDYDWNSKTRVGVNVIGTLNKRGDEDKGWVAEIAIPIADVGGLSTPAVTTPKVGDTWRINLFRMDTPEGKPQSASGWSPPMVGDFHALDKFGELVFGDEKGLLPAVAAAAAAKPGAPAKAGTPLPNPNPQIERAMAGLKGTIGEADAD
ncbi:MAG TPA: carbohydrate-binding family 9-like protein, partial [Polyangia bacterium]